MSQSIVQVWNPNSGSTGATSGSVNSTGKVATTSGNTLILCAGLGDQATSVNTPTNWLAAQIYGGSPSPTICIFYYPNAPSITSQSFSWSGSTKWALALLEISGLGSFASLDGTPGTSNAEWTSGSVITSSTAAALIAAFSSDDGFDSGSGPANGFAIQVNQTGNAHSNSLSLVVATKLNVTAGTQSTSIIAADGGGTYRSTIGAFKTGTSQPLVYPASLLM
jgi:hypothetical protein